MSRIIASAAVSLLGEDRTKDEITINSLGKLDLIRFLVRRKALEWSSVHLTPSTLSIPVDTSNPVSSSVHIAYDS